MIHDHDDPDQNEQPVSGGFRVDVSRRACWPCLVGMVFPPDDERYLSLTIFMMRFAAAECAQVAPWKAAP